MVLVFLSFNAFPRLIPVLCTSYWMCALCSWHNAGCVLWCSRHSMVWETLESASSLFGGGFAPLPLLQLISSPHSPHLGLQAPGVSDLFPVLLKHQWQQPSPMACFICRPPFLRPSHLNKVWGARAVTYWGWGLTCGVVEHCQALKRPSESSFHFCHKRPTGAL